MPARLPLLRPVLLMMGLILTVLLSGACGKKANPVAPVRYVPKAVEGLSYAIKGQSLLISWPVPKINTDQSPLEDLKGFTLRKGEFPAKDYCPTCPDTFQESLWIDLRGPEVPGLQVDPDRVEITTKRLEPGTVYLYQVTAVNKKGLSSEPSSTLKVTWDTPLSPPRLTDLKLKNEGVEVRWEEPQTLIDGRPAEGVAGTLVFRQVDPGLWEKLTPQPLKDRLFVDTQVKEGTAYRYQLKAVREVQGAYLESPLSEEKSISFLRVAPPPAVQELVAVSTPKAVQLRWQGLDSHQVQGYHLYRRTAQEKVPQRITPQVLPVTVFEDAHVQPGVPYFYSISAVGSAPHAVEGPRSLEVEIQYLP
jgi:fibronectin type 3 domain-containing protein